MKLYGVTTAYNNEDLVPYVMKYVSELGYDKFIVYDNGSTDKTVEMLRQYPFVDVRVTPSEKFSELEKMSRLREGVWECYCNHVGNEGYMPGVTEKAWVTITDFDEVIYYTRQDYIMFKEYLNRVSTESHGSINVFNEQFVNLISETPPPDKNEFAHLQVEKCLYGDPFDWEKPILFRIDNMKEYMIFGGQHALGLSYFDQEVKAFHNSRNVHVFHLKYILGKEGYKKLKDTRFQRGVWMEESDITSLGNFDVCLKNAIDIKSYLEHKMLFGKIPGDWDFNIMKL